MELSLRIGRWTLTIESEIDNGRGWATTPLDDGVIHVHPRGDTVVHTLDGDCPCGPDTEDLRHEATLYRHRSLDGRERFE